MLVGRFYKPSDKMLFITLLGFAILSLVIILFNSFIYLEVIIVNIMVFCLLSIFFKEFFFYSLNWIVILLLLLHTWETIDIKLNNFKIDIYDERFMIENCGYYEYSQWDKLFKIIQSI